MKPFKFILFTHYPVQDNRQTKIKHGNKLCNPMNMCSILFYCATYLKNTFFKIMKE